jgi:hypothetical protein
MRVDNRFKTIPYCCFNAENCTNYLGQKGYFGNDIECFHCIDLCSHGTLNKIHCDQAEPFRMKEYKKDYKFFIPEYFVIQKEKGLRPYTFEELPIKVCDSIYLKNKNSEIIERCLCISISSKDNQIKSIAFGLNSYSIQELFENYVWRYSDLWNFQPFGVEE